MLDLARIRPPEAPGHHTWDLTTATLEMVNERCRNDAVRDILRIMSRDFERCGSINGDEFASNVTAILDAIDPETKVFITVTSEAAILFGETLQPPPHYSSNVVRILEATTADRPNVRLISPDPHINSRADFGQGDRAHYSRMVYFRMHDEIVESIAADAKAMADVSA